MNVNVWDVVDDLKSLIERKARRPGPAHGSRCRPCRPHPMIRFIDGFHQDDEGDWVAELLLPAQPARPSSAALPGSAVGARRGRPRRPRGRMLDCPLCDRAEPPSGLEVVRTAGPFDAGDDAGRSAARPPSRRPHLGRLLVLAGTVQLAMETSPRINVRLSAGDAQAIPPGVPHAVGVDGPMCVVIEFARKVVPEQHTRQDPP